MRVLSLITTCSFIAAAIGQDDGSGYFLFPSGRPGNGQPSLITNFNDVVVSSWTSSLPGTMNLILFGSDNTGIDFRARKSAALPQHLSMHSNLTFAVKVMNISVPATGSHSISFASIASIVSNWPVQAHLNLRPSRADGSTGNQGFNSHGFNISSIDRPAKTLMAVPVGSFATLASPPITTTTANSVMTSSSTVATSSASEEPAMHTGRHGSFSTNDGHHFRHGNGNNGSGLSKGAIIGIVVAIVVGSLALFGPAVYLYLRRRRLNGEFANRSSRELDNGASERPPTPPKDPPSPSFEYQFSGPFSQRYYRKASNASTTIVVGLAPSRRPTNASISPASPTRPTIHELRASGQMICEMPATPLRESLEKQSREAVEVKEMQVYEMDSENAVLEKSILSKLEAS